MLKFFAAGDINEVFGTIAPVSDQTYIDPAGGISNLITLGIRLFIIVAGIIALVYMLWGALDWVTSNGEKEMVDKARQKITNAVIGLVLIVAALGIWVMVSGTVLNILKRGPDGNWQFELPTIQTNQCKPLWTACDRTDQASCCSGKCLVPAGDNVFRCVP